MDGLNQGTVNSLHENFSSPPFSKSIVCPFIFILWVSANDNKNFVSINFWRNFSLASLRKRVFLEADSSSKSTGWGFNSAFTLFFFVLICFPCTLKSCVLINPFFLERIHVKIGYKWLHKGNGRNGYS
jgi:hypothetical protein